MCQIYVPKCLGISSWRILRESTQRNPHAWGIAVFDCGKWVIGKDIGQLSRERFAHILSRFQRDSKVIWHFRYRSAGESTYRQAHPFRIGDYVCAHNGHISSLTAYRSDKSDTQVLVSLFKELGIEKCLTSKTFRSHFLSGQRLAIGYPDGRIEKIGIWCAEETSSYGGAPIKVSGYDTSRISYDEKYWERYRSPNSKITESTSLFHDYTPKPRYHDFDTDRYSDR